MSKTPKTPTHDWSRLDAMTDNQRHAAALSDPDAMPLTPDDFKRMKKTPRAKIIRCAMGLSQEEFALAVEMINNRRVDLKPLLTEVLPLSQARQAFDLASDRSRAMKVQIAF